MKELKKNKYNFMKHTKRIAAIILAAGKGERINSKTVNKVVLPLHGKPMIMYVIERLEKLKIKPIIVVIGFAKKSILDLLNKNKDVIFAEQKERLGTAHAVFCALKKMPSFVTDSIILQGDDSAFYKEETIKALIRKHFSSNSDLTFLTIELDNPFGLGRILRDENDCLIGSIEEKDATEEEKKIKEINPALYIFKIKFLQQYLKKIKKSKITGEYYLPDLIRIAIKHKKKIETVKAGKIPWRGVNTKEELEEAKRLLTVSR